MFGSLILTLMLLAQNGQDYYQQALVQERAAGNLQAAIQLYQDAARYAGNDRALAAQAMLGAARCYEKLGQAKARELYEEIARTYVDQPKQAGEARQRAQALQPREHVMYTAVHTEGVGPGSEAQIFAVGPGMYWSKESQFDFTRPMRIRGTVSAIHVVNPSVTLVVNVAGPDVKPNAFTVRGGAPRTLMEQGFTRDMIKPGDIVTVEGLGSVEPNSRVIGLATITLADGRKLPFGQSVSGQ